MASNKTPPPDETPVSPEAAIPRNPQNGQASTDRSLVDGDRRELSDGGAGSAQHSDDRPAAR
jgi:hypothetical protein